MHNNNQTLYNNLNRQQQHNNQIFTNSERKRKNDNSNSIFIKSPQNNSEAEFEQEIRHEKVKNKKITNAKSKIVDKNNNNMEQF